jgi:hypothetical protein
MSWNTQKKDSKYFHIVRDWWLENCTMKMLAKFVDSCQDTLHSLQYSIPIKPINLLIGQSENKKISQDGYEIQIPNTFSQNITDYLFMAAMVREDLFLVTKKDGVFIKPSEKVLNQFQFKCQQYQIKNVPGGRRMVWWWYGTHRKDRGIDISLHSI